MSVTLLPKSASSWTWNGPASTVVFANAWSASAAPATPTRIGPRSLAQRGMRAMPGTVASGLVEPDGLPQAGMSAAPGSANSLATSRNGSTNGDAWVADHATP